MEEEKGKEEEMEQDRARGREKGWGAREGAETANRQREGRMKRNRGRGRWEKEGERGAREERKAVERGRREPAVGSQSRSAPFTALKTPAGCGPPAAPPRIPNRGLQGRRPYLAVPRGPARWGAPPPADRKSVV